MDFDSSLGATYVGVTVAACLYGISTLHVYTYLNRQRQDSAIKRFTIVVLWFADTIKLVCATHIGYRLLITEYLNNPAALFYSTWSINLEILLTTLIIFVVQVFTSHYVWKSTNRINVRWASPGVVRHMGIMAALFSFLQLAFGIALSSLAWVYWDIRVIDQHWWISTVWLGSAAFSNIIITYLLSALLVSTFTLGQNTIDVTSGLIRFIVHTGHLTSILTITNLLAFSFMGHYTRIAVNVPLGTLNLITLLVVLNARPQEPSDGALEERECGVTRNTDCLQMDTGRTSPEVFPRKPSLKVPPKAHKKARSIKVFVQKDVHVISIPRVAVSYSHSMTKHQDDPDGSESTRNLGCFGETPNLPYKPIRI
ncbi:hypothetical protein RSOLAG22IIIB_12137 [Rhizoctonia solani]|uniref:DUF6534 domain-containing protein n=1 Tax=Rhizoctonia solani TaxID=456999 RepID=A0A0K6GC67_9AGAM|nr:unnamed protein product [Rhizoctonia solani]CUA76213.1 hypothetical protein RSOLAG22IIIB_12137 [Rhizoctonia solani]